MRGIRFGLVVLGLLLFTGTAHANTTAGKLREYCTSTQKDSSTWDREDWTNVAFCYGYIHGLVEGINGYYAYNEKEKTFYQFQLQDGVTPDQVARVFLKYINVAPEDEHKDADTVLPLVLVAAKLMAAVPTDRHNLQSSIQ